MTCLDFLPKLPRLAAVTPTPHLQQVWATSAASVLPASFSKATSERASSAFEVRDDMAGVAGAGVCGADLGSHFIGVDGAFAARTFRTLEDFRAVMRMTGMMWQLVRIGNGCENLKAPGQKWLRNEHYSTLILTPILRTPNTTLPLPLAPPLPPNPKPTHTLSLAPTPHTPYPARTSK